jgi:hypothetical protein
LQETALGLVIFLSSVGRVTACRLRFINGGFRLFLWLPELFFFVRWIGFDLCGDPLQLYRSWKIQLMPKNGFIIMKCPSLKQMAGFCQCAVTCSSVE